MVVLVFHVAIFIATLGIKGTWSLCLRFPVSRRMTTLALWLVIVTTIFLPIGPIVVPFWDYLIEF